MQLVSSVQQLKSRLAADDVSLAQRILHNLPAVLFCVACAVWFGYYICMTSYFVEVIARHQRILSEGFVTHRILLLLAVAELCRIWRGEYGPRDVLALCITALMVYGSIRVGSEYAQSAIALVFCARNLNMRRVCKGCFILSGALVLLIVLSSLVGIIPDAMLYAQGHAPRHCLGFRYPLYIPQYLFGLTCAWCWLRAGNMRLREHVVLAVLAIVVFYLTEALLAFVASAFVLVVSFAFQKTNKREVLWLRIGMVLQWTFVAVAIVSAVVSVAYVRDSRSDSMVRLNDVVHGRAELALESAKDYKITLSGSKKYPSEGGLTVSKAGADPAITYDRIYNGFVYVSIRYGLVFAVGLTLLYTACARTAQQEHDVMLVVVLAAIALNCLLSNLAFMLNYDLLLFVAAGLSIKGVFGRSLTREGIATDS